MRFRKTFLINLQLFGSAILFLILYFVLSTHSRLASDDYYYLYLQNQFGAWDGMVYQYFKWSGRWSAHLFACGLIKFWESPLLLPAINFSSLIALYITINGLLKIVREKLAITVDRLTASGISLLIIISFFFTSYNIGESWFWFIIIITYLWSLICFLSLLNIFYSERKGRLKYAAIFILSGFIGGASESFAAVFVLAHLVFIYRELKSKRRSEFLNVVTFSLTIICTSFAFSYFAPGTEVRTSQMPSKEIQMKIWILIKSLGKYFIQFLPSKIYYLFILSLPFLFIGELKKDIFIGRNKWKLFRRMTALLIILLIIFFIPTVWIMSQSGPDRALLPVSLVTVLYFATTFLFIGSTINLNGKVNITFQIASFLVIFSALFIIVKKELNSSKLFSKAYDQRIEFIQNFKQQKYTGILEVEKLPDSGMLYWDELSTDTGHFINTHLRKGLELPFALKLKSKSP